MFVQDETSAVRVDNGFQAYWLGRTSEMSKERDVVAQSALLSMGKSGIRISPNKEDVKLEAAAKVCSHAVESTNVCSRYVSRRLSSQRPQPAIERIKRTFCCRILPRERQTSSTDGCLKNRSSREQTSLSRLAEGSALPSREYQQMSSRERA